MRLFEFRSMIKLDQKEYKTTWLGEEGDPLAIVQGI